jgi:hypothetical protein
MVVERLDRLDSPWALTGPIAGYFLAAMPSPWQLSVYVEDLDVAAERLELLPASGNANIWLAEPFGHVVFERTTDTHKVRIAAPSQVLVDLLTSTDPDPTYGDALLEWMGDNEDLWRTR